MTQEEFDNRKWTAGDMVAIHSRYVRDTVKEVVTVDFAERLIGVFLRKHDDIVTWFRCESCELISTQCLN